MYFLKKNSLNVIMFILLFGVLGTLINFIIPVQSIDYEEYYTLEGDVPPNTSSILNTMANEQINAESSVKTVEISHDAGSSMIQLNIHTNSRDNIEGIKSQFDSILSDSGYSVSDTRGMNIYETENTFLKVFILVASLFVGLVIGIIFSLLTRNISTEEDFEYYLGEKTLGSF